jgi:hypothetical protein
MRLLPAVVTSTIGRDCLMEAIESVARQTRPARHYIFIDGPEVEEKARNVIEQSNLAENTTIIPLPNNTGKNMYTCSRINAMAAYMITEDVILFLDDDNWYEEDHVETVVGLMEKFNLDWSCSLRNIVEDDGSFACADECESLGLLKNHAGQYHVDTSCLALRTDIAQKMASFWQHQKWMDRVVLRAIVEAKFKGGCTGKATMNYRLSKDGLGNMPGNNFKVLSQRMIELNPTRPWANEVTYKFGK